MVQVFHVPLEERRYKDNSQFGEGEEAKVCLDIMQRTGAHIELSLAKDQGLSIMVTGKLDNVMKARKEIVARLQTQVSWYVCARVCARVTKIEVQQKLAIAAGNGVNMLNMMKSLPGC